MNGGGGLIIFGRVKEPAWAVYALLSIWICVIIFCAEDGRAPRETLASDGVRSVLIIDPGHGGIDGGAVSVTGMSESRINWQIAQTTYELARFLGVDTVMTRQKEQIDYPDGITSISGRKRWETRERAALINAVDGGFLLSIHQNKYPAPQPWGVQVFHADDEASRQAAAQLQERFTAVLQPENRRAAALIGKDVYLINHVECPAVLVECGFLSNPAEARELETASFQIKLSMVMAAFFRGRLTGEDHL